MNTSFWSHCQGLIRRLHQRRPAPRPRERQRRWWMAETLEARALLASTPAMVADINPGTAPSWGGYREMLAIGSTAYFTADDGTHGFELWKSDGTAAGTMMVKDVSPGDGSSNTQSLTDVNGTLFFTANDGVHGYELWKSNGTAAGTVMVKDIFPGGFTDYYGAYSPNNSMPSNLTNVNGTLFFTANDGVHGYELWTSNGTAAGTVMVKDIFPGGFTDYYGAYYPNNSMPSNLTNVNGTLFFAASGPTGGLWKSDGTAAGTVAVGSAGYDSPRQLTNVNGTLFFAAYGADGNELWKSDGTAAGTTQVKDIYAGRTRYYGDYGASWTVANNSNPRALTVVNGTLFFTATDSAHRRELWKSDGTAAGTVMVADTMPGNVAYYTDLTNVNGTLYFIATDHTDALFGWSDGIYGFELWKSDGTAAGTAMVKDIIPGSVGSYPSSLTNVNGTLYFRADDGISGYELWKSNGTAAGTVMTADINAVGPWFPGSSLANANGILFFAANDGVRGTELWALNTVPAPSLGVSGFPASTTAGSAGSFTITAKNADETTNTGYLGTVHFTSTDPQAVLPADYTFTAVDHGTHTFTARLKTAGTQSITATDTQSPGNAGAESNILVKPGAAGTMTVSGFPSTTTAGVAHNFTVTLKDPYGNIATAYTGAVRFTSSDAKAVFPANYTFTSSDAGKHTFSVTLKSAGARSITAADTLMAALTATTGGITVTAAAASKFVVTAPSTVKAGVAFSLQLTAQDAYGNVVTGYTGTVRFTSTDNTAKLPAAYTFTATDNGVHTFTGLVLRKKGKQKITITDTLSSSLSSTLSENVK